MDEELDLTACYSQFHLLLLEFSGKRMVGWDLLYGQYRELPHLSSK